MMRVSKLIDSFPPPSNLHQITYIYIYSAHRSLSIQFWWVVLCKGFSDEVTFSRARKRFDVPSAISSRKERSDTNLCTSIGISDIVVGRNEEEEEVTWK
ncbi:hypothetical protein BDE02_14G005100 [Populus trichocarpa]|nr:hypothetical protein BDE02_14G005100 [Populus trichocarpa]